MFELNKLKAIQVGLASPEKIRAWSHGEVKNQKLLTIDPKSQNQMVCSVNVSLVLARIMNVTAVNTRR